MLRIIIMLPGTDRVLSLCQQANWRNTSLFYSLGSRLSCSIVCTAATWQCMFSAALICCVAIILTLKIHDVWKFLAYFNSLCVSALYLELKILLKIWFELMTSYFTILCSNYMAMEAVGSERGIQMLNVTQLNSY